MTIASFAAAELLPVISAQQRRVETTDVTEFGGGKPTSSGGVLLGQEGVSSYPPPGLVTAPLRAALPFKGPL